MSLFTLVFKPIVRQATRRVLTTQAKQARNSGLELWLSRDIERLLVETWQRFLLYEPRLPSEPTIGSRISVRLATLDICLYHAFLSRGIERQEAMKIVKEINWYVYKKGMKLPYWLALLITKNPVRQIQIISDLIMQRFPFNPPGFQSAVLPSERGGRFDVLRCPVADQMQTLLPEQDARDLCVTTWCSLDYPAAVVWGGALERQGTIAAGANRCDFHFVAAQKTGPGRRVTI